MRLRTSSVRFALAGALVFAVCVPSRAAGCDDLVARHVQMLKKDPANALFTTITTNQDDRHFASAAFNLRLYATSDTMLETKPGFGGWQLFSDRASFKGQADRLGLRIVGGAPPRVEFILMSWDNGVIVGAPLACEGGLVSGTIGLDSAFSLSLRVARGI